MGGHGGLNILPQKKWNVYNYDNRDIVEKDKKQHAQKLRKNYQTQRKHTIQRKFDVLKGQSSILQKTQQTLKQSYKKDSILNNQFKRLAEENQHVNLFQHEQKIIQNREVLEYQKLKQSEWLKDKDMDYSSKFLGTYNDDGKIPWYAKCKGLIVDDKNEQKKMSRQRYDMQDLTDKLRLQKLQVKREYCISQRQKLRMISLQNKKNEYREQQSQIKVKRQLNDNDDRQRSRNKKYQFIKQRQHLSTELKQSKEIRHQQQQSINANSSNIKQSLDKQIAQQKKQENNHQINPQLQLLRLKRLKRQQKQRKKAQQLKKKLLQSINRN